MSELMSAIKRELTEVVRHLIEVHQCEIKLEDLEMAVVKDPEILGLLLSNKNLLSKEITGFGGRLERNYQVKLLGIAARHGRVRAAKILVKTFGRNAINEDCLMAAFVGKKKEILQLYADNIYL